MAYPSVLSTLSNPQPTDRLNSPSHSSIHQAENTAITEIQTFVGTISSAVGTLVYDIRSTNSNGGGHIQTANTGGTGQTTFTKGDLLVASSSSVLVKVAIGSDTQALLADSSQAAGVKWATPAGANVQSFVSTGIWNKPSALGLLSRVYVELWGGGGSGGAYVGNDGAGGGGGGAYAGGWFNASVLGTSELVVVGIGGASVTATSNGNAGTVTVFGSLSSLLSAYPGGGGAGGNGAASGGGGGGGGVLSAGGSATNNNGGTAGDMGGALSTAGGSYASPNVSDAYIASGGGGTGGAPGLSIYGGAGGGGAGIAGPSVAGGISKFGGNGGLGGPSITATSGSLKGGGGGAARGASNARSGAGGNGYAIITSFP